MAKARALKANEATKSSPKIVEDHSGEIDITQSMAAMVTVRIKSTMPGPARMRIFLVAAPSLPLSCARDHLFKRNANNNQIAKQPRVRIVKKFGFKYLLILSTIAGSA